MLECMNDTVHDRLHVYRVVNYAAQLADQTDGVDFDVVIAAALLHDIGRWRNSGDKNVCHAVVGSAKAKQYLLSKGVSGDFAEHVSQCILSPAQKGQGCLQSTGGPDCL